MKNEMWLRVVLYRAQDPQDPSAIAYMKSSAQEVVTILEGEPGFQAGYWGYNTADGTMAAVTYWDDRDAVQAAVESRLNTLRTEREANGINVIHEAVVQLFAIPNPEGKRRF